MKKTIFSFLAITVMVSCSDGPVLKPIEKDLVEIKMVSSVTPGTRAAIESDDSGLLKTGPINVHFVRAADAATADWSTATTLVEATLDASGDITFASAQYYNVDETKNSHLFGYYAGTEITPSSGKLTVPITNGDLDVLYTKIPVSGNKTTVGALQPVFDHALAWVKIQIKGDAAASAIWGDVTKITIKDVAKNVEITLGASASIAYDTEKGDITLSNTMAIPTDFADYSDCLAEPLASYTLEITATNKTQTLNISVNGSGAVAGKISNLELTFRGAEVSAKSTVTPWEEGEKGSGEVI